MSELAFKIVVTAIAVAGLFWIWTHQTDPVATLTGALRDRIVPSWVAVRDPGKLYQDGQPMADVAGPVEESGDRVVFHLLANAPEIQTGTTLEYKRRTLRVVSIDSIIGHYAVAGPSGTQDLSSVRKDVVCEGPASSPHSLP